MGANQLSHSGHWDCVLKGDSCLSLVGHLVRQSRGTHRPTGAGAGLESTILAEVGGAGVDPDVTPLTLDMNTDSGFDLTALEPRARERLYRGNSMRGTFVAGDGLVISVLNVATVRCGDVVVFADRNGTAESRDVVHRVVRVCPEGLITRGDSNHFEDPVPVTAENLVGVVTQVRRGQRLIRVAGGWRGMWRARVQRVRGLTRRILGRLARRPYHALRVSGLVRRVWRPTVRVLVVRYDHGPVAKVLVAGRSVASVNLTTGRFVCRKPYDLVLQREDFEGIKL